jgi:hypothetical protein
MVQGSATTDYQVGSLDFSGLGQMAQGARTEKPY